MAWSPKPGGCTLSLAHGPESARILEAGFVAVQEREVARGEWRVGRHEIGEVARATQSQDCRSGRRGVAAAVGAYMESW